MRGWRHRNQIHRRIDAAGATNRKDARKALLEIPAQHPRVEPDVPASDFLSEDFAGDDIARCQLGQPMPLEHEPLSFLIQQDRAFSTHGLGDELQRILRRIEGGRMELHEFHVGEPDSPTMRNRETISRGNLRIGRVAVDLPATARCQHRCIGDDLHRLSCDRRLDPEHHSVFGDQIENARFLQHLDPRRLLDALDQSARDLGTGLIAVRVDDSPARVGSFAAEFEIPSRLQIELRPRGRQFADTRGTFFDEDFDCLRVGEGSTCCQSILSMELGRVSSAQCCGDSSLRVSGRTIEERAFGQHHHVVVSRGAPCSVKTSNSASHYEKARPYPLGHALKSMRDEKLLKGVKSPCTAL